MQNNAKIIQSVKQVTKPYMHTIWSIQEKSKGGQGGILLGLL